MNMVELTLLMGLLWGKGGYSRRGSGQSTYPTGHDRGPGEGTGGGISRRDSGGVVRSRVGSILTASIERSHRAGIWSLPPARDNASSKNSPVPALPLADPTPNSATATLHHQPWPLTSDSLRIKMSASKSFALF